MLLWAHATLHEIKRVIAGQEGVTDIEEEVEAGQGEKKTLDLHGPNNTNFPSRKVEKAFSMLVDAQKIDAYI